MPQLSSGITRSSTASQLSWHGKETGRLPVGRIPGVGEDTEGKLGPRSI